MIFLLCQGKHASPLRTRKKTCVHTFKYFKHLVVQSREYRRSHRTVGALPKDCTTCAVAPSISARGVHGLREPLNMPRLRVTTFQTSCCSKLWLLQLFKASSEIPKTRFSIIEKNNNNTVRDRAKAISPELPDAVPDAQ